MSFRTQLRFVELLEKADALVCGFLPDKNRYSMQKLFSRDNLEFFVKSFMNDSLLPFLNSGYLDDQKLRLTAAAESASQVNAYEFIMELNDTQEKIETGLSGFTQCFYSHSHRGIFMEYHSKVVPLDTVEIKRIK